MALWGAAVTAAAGALSGGLGAESARKNAHANRSWQAAMSNTSYQRAVKDLRKANLNPMLAYTQGGASTPQGATADTADYSQVVSSALAAKRLSADLSKIKSEENLNNQLAKSAKSKASLDDASKANVQEQTKRNKVIGDAINIMGPWMQDYSNTSQYLRDKAVQQKKNWNKPKQNQKIWRKP